MGIKPPLPLEERFWPKVDKSAGDDGCWLWTAFRRPLGYGQIMVRMGSVNRYSPRGAHRIAWELTNGPIPAGLYVLHQCDNPPCVNPAHMRLGTQADNMRECSERGRWTPRKTLRGEESPTARLSELQILEIRSLHGTGGWTYPKLGERYGVTTAYVGEIVRRETWKHLT